MTGPVVWTVICLGERGVVGNVPKSSSSRLRGKRRIANGVYSVFERRKRVKTKSWSPVLIPSEPKKL
jgi:hypothetical protein